MTLSLFARRFLQSNEVYSNYTNILVMLTRLRQAANHPHLVTKHNGYSSTEDPEDTSAPGDCIRIPYCGYICVQLPSYLLVPSVSSFALN